MTVKEAIRRQVLYRALLVKTILQSMDRWGAQRWRRNVHQRQMVRIPKKQPAFPPPGPLGIRSGKLARTIRTEPARYFAPSTFQKRLLAGGSGVRYARIHEKGGMAGRGRRTRIPARPYMMPAWQETRRFLHDDTQASVNALQRRVFGKGAGRAS